MLAMPESAVCTASSSLLQLYQAEAGLCEIGAVRELGRKDARTDSPVEIDLSSSLSQTTYLLCKLKQVISPL